MCQDYAQGYLFQGIFSGQLAGYKNVIVFFADIGLE